MLRIEAGLLIPGDAQPVTDGVVVADGETITYAGTAAGAPQTPDAEVVAAAVVMPGLWDCHGHFFGMRAAEVARARPNRSRCGRRGRYGIWATR